jgi:hypothetical protein
MVLRKHHGVRLLTRNGYEWTDRYPAIARAVAALKITSCVIDGEIAVCGDRGLAVSISRGRATGSSMTPSCSPLACWNSTARTTSGGPLRCGSERSPKLTANAPSGLQLVEHGNQTAIADERS